MKSILVFVACLAAMRLFSQDTSIEHFPLSWQGQWAGKLEIWNAGGKVQELPMELHILPLDTAGRYTWTLIYGEDKEAGKRPYELLPLDPAKGLYLLDEKNTIKMEAYLLGGRFYQWFEVEGTLLFTATSLEGDSLIWEIVSGSATPISTTGGQEWQGEAIPPVKAFPLRVLQRAVLRKG
jgi:hypothetical protein